MGGSVGESEALETEERLRELQESLGRLDFAAQAQAENTVQAYAADLEDFRHWCKRMDREWLPAQPKTIGLYLGARADELSLSTLEATVGRNRLPAQKGTLRVTGVGGRGAAQENLERHRSGKDPPAR